MKGKTGKEKSYSTLKRLKPEDWTEECDLAVEKIKRSPSQTTVLAHQDPSFY